MQDGDKKLVESDKNPEPPRLDSFECSDDDEDDENAQPGDTLTSRRRQRAKFLQLFWERAGRQRVANRVSYDDKAFVQPSLAMPTTSTVGGLTAIQVLTTPLPLVPQVTVSPVASTSFLSF